MQSCFLDKFESKASKVFKQGFLNLFELSDKKPVKQTPIIFIQKSYIQRRMRKNQIGKKQKSSLSQKQNKMTIVVLDIKPIPKKLNLKAVSKNEDSKQTLILKQIKKPFNSQNNVKKYPLKLSIISKKKTLNTALPARQNPQQIKRLHRQKTQITDQNQGKKPQKSFLHDSLQVGYERSNRKNHTLESLLNEEALGQLKKLNDFERIVHKIQINRKRQFQEQQLIQQSRHYPKGVTAHN